jgi:hypothetical protein
VKFDMLFYLGEEHNDTNVDTVMTLLHHFNKDLPKDAWIESEMSQMDKKANKQRGHSFSSLLDTAKQGVQAFIS